MIEWFMSLLDIQLWKSILLIGFVLLGFGFIAQLKIEEMGNTDKKSINIIYDIALRSFPCGGFIILLSLTMLMLSGLYNISNDYLERRIENAEIVRSELEETMETIEDYHNSGWSVYIDGQKIEEVNAHSINIWNYDISYEQDTKKIYLRSK